MTITPADRLKLADDALLLCRKTGKIPSITRRTELQAMAIFLLVKMERPDMRIYREALRIDRGTFDKAMHLARQIRRNNRIPEIKIPTLLEQEIIRQFKELVEEVAK